MLLLGLFKLLIDYLLFLSSHPLACCTMLVPSFQVGLVCLDIAGDDKTSISFCLDICPCVTCDYYQIFLGLRSYMILLT